VKGAVADIVRLFADVKLQPAQAKELFLFITCQLRGLAFVTLFEESRELDADLAILKEVAVQIVECAPSKAAARMRKSSRGTRR